MLILNPAKLSLLGLEYGSIESVKVNQLAHREVVEWSDAGPHAVFADIPECRVEIEISQRLESGTADQSLDGPKPGQLGAFEVITSPNASQARRRKLSAQCVIKSVRNEAGPRAKRTITLIALSSDGSTDPITTTDF